CYQENRMSKLVEKIEALSSRQRLELDRLMHQRGLSISSLPIPRLEERRGLPLSYAQQRLWFLEQLDGGGGGRHNIAAAVRLEGELDVEALRRGLRSIVARHEALRTRFVVKDGAPVQVIEEEARLELEEVDLSGVAAAERELEAGRELAGARRRDFDLAAGPLLRA